MRGEGNRMEVNLHGEIAPPSEHLDKEYLINGENNQHVQIDEHCQMSKILKNG
jgi:hypothetical protein